MIPNKSVMCTPWPFHDRVNDNAHTIWQLMECCIFLLTKNRSLSPAGVAMRTCVPSTIPSVFGKPIWANLILTLSCSCTSLTWKLNSHWPLSWYYVRHFMNGSWNRGFANAMYIGSQRKKWTTGKIPECDAKLQAGRNCTTPFCFMLQILLHFIQKKIKWWSVQSESLLKFCIIVAVQRIETISEDAHGNVPVPLTISSSDDRSHNAREIKHRPTLSSW